MGKSEVSGRGMKVKPICQLLAVFLVIGQSADAWGQSASSAEQGNGQQANQQKSEGSAFALRGNAEEDASPLNTVQRKNGASSKQRYLPMNPQSAEDLSRQLNGELEKARLMPTAGFLVPRVPSRGFSGSLYQGQLPLYGNVQQAPLYGNVRQPQLYGNAQQQQQQPQKLHSLSPEQARLFQLQVQQADRLNNPNQNLSGMIDAELGRRAPSFSGSILDAGSQRGANSPGKLIDQELSFRGVGLGGVAQVDSAIACGRSHGHGDGA